MAEIAEECKQECYDLFVLAAQQEKEWADYLFRDGSMIGLNKDILCQYVEYITNIRMQAVGLDLPFQTRSNPDPMDQHLAGLRQRSGGAAGSGSQFLSRRPDRF
ncbi:ribonucleotide-diphosphate reductase subunit beta [Klebsiella pneumoniae]|uniref:Ribonucleotide-diphosphate reductase subunit beta n=1 Tax=Klebsiella pneumoniae TaxID=573 RepID=A0A377V8P2_KLEPN|nr:ribonucleotide-diphosphate reductase subunit beta [Klebsiella pneumoniae]